MIDDDARFIFFNTEREQDSDSLDFRPYMPGEAAWTGFVHLFETIQAR